MSLEINQIESEGDFAHRKFRGARKGRLTLLHGLWGSGRFGRVGPGRVAGREATETIGEQPGSEQSHDVLLDQQDESVTFLLRIGNKGRKVVLPQRPGKSKEAQVVRWLEHLLQG